MNKPGFSGPTKRPQAATINAVLRALGYKLGVVPFSNAVHIVPALPQPKPKPREETRHVLRMAKYRRR